MLTVVKNGVMMRFDDDEFDETPYVYRPMLKGHVYEESFLEHVRTLHIPGVYVDVGAHLGTHAIWFAMQCPSVRVHAVEAIDTFAHTVRVNALKNRVDGKVRVHRVAVGKAPGQLKRLAMSTGPVPVVRLDDLIRDPVALLKLDIEGMEAPALAGAMRLLDRWRPRVFAESFTETEAAEVLDVLGQFGYEATGRHWGGTPTYEYVAPPPKSLTSAVLVETWRRHVPTPVRRQVHRARRRVTGGVLSG